MSLIVSGEPLTKTDTELALEIIRFWSSENSTSDIDWRRMHAASNLLALTQYRLAEPLSHAWAEMVAAEDKMARMEVRAFAELFDACMQGEARGIDGRLLPKLSASQSEPVARKLALLDKRVIEAKADYAIKKTIYIRLMKEFDSLREAEQGGKSTAQRLKEDA